jgi:tetratricopeptide (TPR) repeat protein
MQRSYLVGGQGLLDSGIEAAERACSLAEGIDDELLKISAILALAEATTVRGDVQRAIGLVKPIMGSLIGDLRHERAGMFGTLSTRALGYLSLSYTNLGQFDQALRCGREALMIAHEAQRPIDLAYCHYRIGLALLMKGDLPDAIESLEQGLTHCRVSCFGWLLPRLAAALGYGYALSGQISRAPPLLEEAITQAKASGMIMAEALATAWLAKVDALAGELDVAAIGGRYALDLAQRYGYWHIEALSLRVLGTIDAERGGAHTGDAERQLREALALADKRGFRPQAAHCRLALGRLLRQVGRRADARRDLEAATALYEAMAMTRWLSEAHAELHLSSS